VFTFNNTTPPLLPHSYTAPLLLPASFLVVYVQAALKISIVPIVKSSTFTLAFNLTMFIAIHAAAVVSAASPSPTPHVIYSTPIKEQVRHRHLIALRFILHRVAAPLIFHIFQIYGGEACSSSSSGASMSAFAQILFSGIGQIYLVGDPISGALMLVGTAFASRVCAACMCAGVIVGSLVGAFLGASLCDLASGLYGYDASLSFIAVYYALCSGSKRKLMHATAAAAAATLVHTAVGFTMARAGLPSGTLGFVFATMVVVCCIRGSERVQQQSAAASDVQLVSSCEEEPEQHQQQSNLQQMIALQEALEQHSPSAAAAGNLQLHPASPCVPITPPQGLPPLQQRPCHSHSSIVQQV
jgi:urea transporter